MQLRQCSLIAQPYSADRCEEAVVWSPCRSFRLSLIEYDRSVLTGTLETVAENLRHIPLVLVA